MKYILSFATILFFNIINAQSIIGNLSKIKGNNITLIGYDGLQEKELAKTQCDSLGNFQLNYPINYIGAATLQIKDSKSVIILLNNENFNLQWQDLQDFKTLKFINSIENEVFAKSISINQNSEQKLSGLKYLLPQYEKYTKQSVWLKKEIANQNNKFINFVNNLPDNNYAKYYITIRKLITDMPITANRYIDRMPEHEQQFNTLNFNEPKLLKSGLLKELLDSYFKLMESHLKEDEMYNHIATSTDAVLKNLKSNETLQQEVAQYLFKYFEKRSLFKAAEHLALAMLNQTNCQNSEKNALFEQYRKMAVGQTAPEIQFENSKFDKKKLFEINAKYKLVVFGASWCEKCNEEIPKLQTYYTDWKTNYNLEIILNSLDTQKDKYETFVKNFTFITTCDYKAWEGKATKDYFVFGTPTIYLLDNNNKILLKPVSLEQIETWLQTFGHKL